MSRLLVTGGAGFIGVNCAAHFAAKGWDVTVLDNLSRRGAEANLSWLSANAPVRAVRSDIRDAAALRQVVAEGRPDAVLHLAGQVAVTTSLVDPRTDFEVNALGTLNLLEAVRLERPDAFVIYASTNKVYGRMEDVGIDERDGRYSYRDLPLGVPESRCLDFHSPYGCSKGTGDQYVLDYGRSFGVRAVSFRQSCIYGPRQFGVEDQGWLAWFVIASQMGRPITIFGDGKQVRDVLHVQDLIRCYELAMKRPEAAAGRAFNIGGGPGNAISLLDLLGLLEEKLGRPIPLSWEGWRVGDQPVFVCDVRQAWERLGWKPEIPWTQGVNGLIRWVGENRSLFDGAPGG